MAQTVDTIMKQLKVFENNPQINVGIEPSSIAVNDQTNKIYVGNLMSGTVSVIDSNSGRKAKDIPVGELPAYIVVTPFHNRIYVANRDSNTVSVINGNTDTEIERISVGKQPTSIVVGFHKIYVTNSGSNTVSVIDPTNDTRISDIPVGKQPTSIVVGFHKIYVTNSGSNTVSVINASTDKKEVPDIPVGKQPTSIVVGFHKIYVTNSGSNTVSVIDPTNKTVRNIPVGYSPTSLMVVLHKHDHNWEDKIYVTNSGNNTVSVINATKREVRVLPAGLNPEYIAYNNVTDMIYVVNEGSNTVSVIDGSSDKIAAGVTLKINPENSGSIWCNNKEYPTNFYLYIDNGTKCKGTPNRDFEFIDWLENLNQNSTLPLNASAISSASFNVNRSGTFTANFKPLPTAMPPEEAFSNFTTTMTAALIGAIPGISLWIKTRRERNYLKMVMNEIGKLDKNSMEDVINASYTAGKINKDDREILKDRISEYYKHEKGSKD
jgi:YVTN family beta-propeller protein